MHFRTLTYFYRTSPVDTDLLFSGLPSRFFWQKNVVSVVLRKVQKDFLVTVYASLCRARLVVGRQLVYQLIQSILSDLPHE